VDRRRFLKWSAAGTTGVIGSALTPWLGACAQLDRMIVGDGADETRSVLIIGAGISGLVAARELKKLGVPFRLFEGSNRVGGRAYSLENFNIASQSADMGAEWLGDNDSFVLSLCKELRVLTHELPASSRMPSFFANEGWTDPQALLKELKQVDHRLAQIKDNFSDEKLDALSVEELLGKMKSSASSSTLLWMRRLVQQEWGSDPENISSLAYYDRFATNPTGWKRVQARRIKISGGTQNLAYALYDKIVGVVPDRFVLFGHKLKAMRSKTDNLELDFETKDGVFSIDAKVVICTVPFSVLREVKGIENMDFTPQKLNAIQNLGYGTHGKIAASYDNKFWPSKVHQWTGDLRSQWIWDSTYEGGRFNLTTRGILSAQLGGKAGQELGLHSFEDFKQDLKFLNARAKEIPVEEQVQLMNWSQNKWSIGSTALFRPGHVHAFSSALASSERKGTFIFAGEHTSASSMGTLNGAVESGIRAAQEAARFKTEISRNKRAMG
jgi:monoamine oxidase